MKEIIVRIPEESEEMLTAIIEKFGAEIEEVKLKKKSGKKQKLSKKKSSSKKIDHTFLFDKWKDFDIDPQKLRSESW